MAATGGVVSEGWEAGGGDSVGVDGPEVLRVAEE